MSRMQVNTITAATNPAKSAVTYNEHYNSACDMMDFVVESLSERPGRVIALAIEAGGETAVQALFDATMDHGHRMALVEALNAPSLPEWVREKLNVFLYGESSAQIAALFRKTYH